VTSANRGRAALGGLVHQFADSRGVGGPALSGEEVADAGEGAQLGAGDRGGDVVRRPDPQQRVAFAVQDEGRRSDLLEPAAGPRGADLAALRLVVAEARDLVLRLLFDERVDVALLDRLPRCGQKARDGHGQVDGAFVRLGEVQPGEAADRAKLHISQNAHALDVAGHGRGCRQAQPGCTVRFAL
jgi:hypothetical protein